MPLRDGLHGNPCLPLFPWQRVILPNFPLNMFFFAFLSLYKVTRPVAMTTTNHTRDKRLLTCSELGRVPRQNKGSLPYYVFPLERGGGFSILSAEKGYSLDCALFLNSRRDGPWEGFYSVSGLCFYALWCFNMSELELLGLNLQSEYFFLLKWKKLT